MFTNSSNELTTIGVWAVGGLASFEEVAVGSGLSDSAGARCLRGPLPGGPWHEIALSIVHGFEQLQGQVAGRIGPN